jgi:hypothetical protein
MSAVVLDGNRLWLGGDEGTLIHRMTRDASGNFAEHASFALKDTLQLPGAATEEIDIEGLDIDGGYLWLIGSHSAKRKKAEEDKTAEENLDRLAKIEMEGNRFTLARVPLDDARRPVAVHGALTAARLEGDAAGNLLTEALIKDRHVGRCVPRVAGDRIEGIPSKDNGFDVEGLAVTGTRVFLGLRAPVLRGWAMIVELNLSTASNGALRLDPIGSSGQVYLKHFLRLEGLGVRELVIHGDDLLVLSGPSMDLDGPVFIHRWKGALNKRADSLTWNKDLTLLVTVPFGITKDHAEGLSLASDAPLSVLVCYDSPSRVNGNETRADVFEIGS